MHMPVIALVALLLSLALICCRSYLPIPIRGAIVGLLIGAAIGFPLAFVVGFLEVFGLRIPILTASLPLLGVYIGSSLWLPALIAVVGMIMGCLISRRRTVTS